MMLSDVCCLFKSLYGWHSVVSLKIITCYRHHYACSTGETFPQEILKCSLPNFWNILKKCLLETTLSIVVSQLWLWQLPFYKGFINLNITAKYKSLFTPITITLWLYKQDIYLFHYNNLSISYINIYVWSNVTFLGNKWLLDSLCCNNIINYNSM